MIGGNDIRVEVPSGAAALDFAVRAIRIRWPHAVFVIDGCDDVIPRYEQLEFHDSSEIIVYKDPIACQQWRRIGYDASLRGTMMYLIGDPTDLTLVVEDQPSAETELLVATILEGIEKTFRFRRPAA